MMTWEEEKRILETWSLAQIETEIRKLVLRARPNHTGDLECHTDENGCGISAKLVWDLDQLDPSQKTHEFLVTMVMAVHHAYKREKGVEIFLFRISIDGSVLTFDYGSAT